MKNLIVVFALLISFSSLALAQETVVKDTTFKVFGNCGQCKSRIEKAMKIKEVKMAKWNKQTKMLSVAFLSPAITVDSLQKRAAAVGHDTEKYKADNAVYEALPGCCLYRDGASSH
jgi:periplasmic mercuric ion binding protein